jgi:hypothetical protein
MNSPFVPALIRRPNIIHPFRNVLPKSWYRFRDFAVFTEDSYNLSQLKLLIDRPFACIIVRYILTEISARTLALCIAMYQLPLVSVATGLGRAEHIVSDFGPSPTLLKESMIRMSRDRRLRKCNLLTTSFSSRRHPSIVLHPDRDGSLAERGRTPTALADLAPHALGHGVNTTR